MKRIIIIFAAVLMCGIAYGQDSQRKRLEKHVYTLASDSLQGRLAGTENGHKAADYIQRQWQQMGLKPMFDDNYDKPFKLGDSGMEQYFAASASGFNNLVAIVEGSDPELKNEYIVVGAHYDHLGVRGGEIYNGADDNASGSACLLEMARQLQSKKGQLKRSVIICAFDAEEMGLLGSKDMVKTLELHEMLGRVKLMMSLDMVGWYQSNGKLEMEGAGTLREPKEWLLPELLGSTLKVNLVSYENSILTATDTEPFAKAGIATLAVSTGLKSPYHKPEDDANLIDYEGLDHITNYLVALTIAASQREGTLASGKVAPKHRPVHGFEMGVALGVNHSYLDFPDATFIGKQSWGFNGGMMMQYNFNKILGLRVNALYNYSHCMLPAASDAYGKGYGLEQHLLLVPLTLQIGYRQGGLGVYFGLGGYYGRVLDGRFYGAVPPLEPPYDVDRNQGGFVWNIGLRLGNHWQLDGTWFYQLTDLFKTTAGLPIARLNIYALTLGYYF